MRWFTCCQASDLVLQEQQQRFSLTLEQHWSGFCWHGLVDLLPSYRPSDAGAAATAAAAAATAGSV
jgi:hypothetical protein